MKNMIIAILLLAASTASAQRQPTIGEIGAGFGVLIASPVLLLSEWRKEARISSRHYRIVGDMIKSDIDNPEMMSCFKEGATTYFKYKTSASGPGFGAQFQGEKVTRFDAYIGGARVSKEKLIDNSRITNEEIEAAYPKMQAAMETCFQNLQQQEIDVLKAIGNHLRAPEITGIRCPYYEMEITLPSDQARMTFDFSNVETFTNLKSQQLEIQVRNGDDWYRISYSGWPGAPHQLTEMYEVNEFTTQEMAELRTKLLKAYKACRPQRFGN